MITFGVDLTNSKHASNKTKDVLVLGRGLILKIDGTTFMQKKCIHLILLLLVKHFA